MNLQSGLFFALTLLFQSSLMAQPKVRYSPAWFGPNANPVPEFTSAIIPAKTQLSAMSDVYFGYSDLTVSGRFKIEVPLIPEFVAIKIWCTPFEYFKVTPALADDRDMLKAEGVAIGDYYVQTRIRVMQESKRGVDMVINTTLKTASGTGQPNKRYFNTAGYYFDFELGKSFDLGAASKTKMRLATDLGFMSWDVSANTQDDALMYGAKVSFMGPRWESVTTLAGYWGWMHTHEKYGADFGDVPLVISTKLIYTKNDYSIFGQYQYGLHNFQYHQIRIGTKFSFQKLTPDFTKFSKSN